MNAIQSSLDYAVAHREAFLKDLAGILAIPSVSTLPEHKADVTRMAEWLASRLTGLGFPEVEVIPTGGHPIVYAERPGLPGRPTVLVYGHYDVQPVDPVEEWLSPPFEATIRGENVHARGASDMKGQTLAQIAAVEALIRNEALGVTVKYLLEGEEEIGSPSLPAFIDTHKDRLRCDFVLNCDAGVHAPDQPSIVYALRGLAYFEVEITGPRQDLHSGMFGGAVENPVNVLCRLIAGMHGPDGRVTLPGFYDKVRELSPEERSLLAALPCSDQLYLDMTGAPALGGEQGYSVVERIGARPTLDVNGIFGGFTGHGAKTVLPARATAKISMRLVPDQVAEEVYGQLCTYLDANAPETVRWHVTDMSYGPPAVTDRRSPWMQAAVKALRESFGAEPVFKREGGSVPIVGILQQKLGADSVMLGFALPDDGIHGPNEKQHLPTLYRGVETYVRFLAGL